MIQKKLYGEEHADLATTYNNLGAVFHSLARYKQAKEYHGKALIIQKKIHGEEHSNVAATYNNRPTLGPKAALSRLKSP